VNLCSGANKFMPQLEHDISYTLVSIAAMPLFIFSEPMARIELATFPFAYTSFSKMLIRGLDCILNLFLKISFPLSVVRAA